MTPLVSVCIPSYNNESHLAAAIDSVLAQSLSNFELIIVDDCSSDSSLSIARSYDDQRIAIFDNPVNLGAAGNWNRACELATGEFVKLLCGDDLLYPSCLERQVAGFQADSTVAMVAAKRDIVATDGSTLVYGRGLRDMAGWVPGDQAVQAAVRSGTNPFGEPASVLMRADALRKVGPFRGEAQYMIDLDMWCRLLAVGDLYAIPESLAAFRVQDQSWSHALARRQSAQARALLAELRRRHPELVPWHVIAEGTARAWALGWGRRATYRALRSPVLGAVLGITLATSETGGPG